MSICLGRPFAVQDEDCCCELPYNIRDEDCHMVCIDQYGLSNQRAQLKGDMPLTGFLEFARLCCISGKCEALNSPSRTRIIASSDLSRKQSYLKKARRCEKSLETWLASLSAEFRSLANALDSDYTQSRELTMCAIAFIMHAGSLLNMYRLVILLQIFLTMTLTATLDALLLCILIPCLRTWRMMRVRSEHSV